MGDEGERLDILVFDKAPNVSTSVFGVYNVLQLVLIAAADPEEDGQRDEGNTAHAPYDTADNRADDGWRIGTSSKANLIIVGTIGVCNLNDARYDH